MLLVPRFSPFQPSRTQPPSPGATVMPSEPASSCCHSRAGSSARAAFLAGSGSLVTPSGARHTETLEQVQPFFTRPRRIGSGVWFSNQKLWCESANRSYSMGFTWPCGSGAPAGFVTGKKSRGPSSSERSGFSPLCTYWAAKLTTNTRATTATVRTINFLGFMTATRDEGEGSRMTGDAPGEGTTSAGRNVPHSNTAAGGVKIGGRGRKMGKRERHGRAGGGDGQVRTGVGFSRNSFCKAEPPAHFLSYLLVSPLRVLLPHAAADHLAGQFVQFKPDLEPLLRPSYGDSLRSAAATLLRASWPFPPEPPPCQGQRTVDDHLLAQGRGDDVVAPGEGLEDALGHEHPQRLEQQLLAHEGDAAADDDAARAEQGDDVAEGLGQSERRVS